MTTKNILSVVFIGLVVFGALSEIFRKQYYANVIRGVYTLNFHDTIQWVRYYKDALGPGIETKFQHRDTPYCFSGYSQSLNDIYLDFAKKGDILFKAPKSDTFYVKRADSVIAFVLSECHWKGPENVSVPMPTLYSNSLAYCSISINYKQNDSIAFYKFFLEKGYG